MALRQHYKVFIKSKVFRILLHIGFWVLYLSLPFMQLEGTAFSRNWYALVTFINVVYAVFYYAFAYFIVPRFFRTKTLHYFAGSTVALYIIFIYIAKTIEKFAIGNYSFNETDIAAINESLSRKPYDLVYLIQVVFVTAIPMSIKFLRSFHKLQAEKSNLEKINTSLELNFLKSQLNPHFLFNSLNNIYALALQKNEKAPDMIIKLSDLMRYILYECNVDKNDLAKEVAFMQDYIDLEKIRHGENVDISFTIHGPLEGKKIPPLLLIPFVENAFKHGVNAQFGRCWVTFELQLTERGLIFKSENNKPMNGASVPTSKVGGIGIENVKKRLELTYPKKHTLQVKQQEQVFQVELKVETL